MLSRDIGSEELSQKIVPWHLASTILAARLMRTGSVFARQKTARSIPHSHFVRIDFCDDDFLKNTKNYPFQRIESSEIESSKWNKRMHVKPISLQAIFAQPIFQVDLNLQVKYSICAEPIAFKIKSDVCDDRFCTVDFQEMLQWGRQKRVPNPQMRCSLEMCMSFTHCRVLLRVSRGQIKYFPLLLQRPSGITWSQKQERSFKRITVKERLLLCVDLHHGAPASVQDRWAIPDSRHVLRTMKIEFMCLCVCSWGSTLWRVWRKGEHFMIRGKCCKQCRW